MLRVFLHISLVPEVSKPSSQFSASLCGYRWMHTIGLTWIMEDISAGLLPWCAKVHTVRISSGNVRNTAIIPSLSILRDLELSRLTFWVVEYYFKLLANLPPTLKKLAVHGIRFRFDNSGTGCYATVRRGAEIEHLETR
ncbi:hypothetical protein ARMSODRAFT_1088001 [Armillaria solidipes]|uniref:F-box domain-containing protein n=1 Tax=Armillaria solidipes TaxID=1076256 RepID=A0A2H3BE24_9AGAR|nr:hypothetical protein ARMSODRAFT_1088001 [Armillaria solidipes]